MRDARLLALLLLLLLPAPAFAQELGLRPTMSPAVAVWPTLFTNWLVSRKLLTMR